MIKTVSSNLKKLRLKKKISQKYLCDELLKQGLYIKRNTYTKYESGKRMIPYDVLYHLAIYYNISLDYIFGLK